jgi:hypothetical protein
MVMDGHGWSWMVMDGHGWYSGVRVRVRVRVRDRVRVMDGIRVCCQRFLSQPGEELSL